MTLRVLVAPAESLEAQCTVLALDAAGVAATTTPSPDVDAILWLAVPGEPTAAARALRSDHPGRPLLLLTPRVEAVAYRLATDLGASGLVGWHAATRALVAAIDRTVSGDKGASDASSDDPLDHLTVRELQIACLLGEGASNDEIATVLHISYHTARTHVAHVLAKLGVSHRYAVVSLLGRSTRLVPVGAAAGGGTS